MSRLGSLFLDTDTPPSQTASACTDLKAEPGGYGVLFVDDEPSVLKAMRRVFRQENYRLYTAESGQAALAVMEANPVNVIISDHRMPGMSGADLLREVKRRNPDTIRIMLTGYADVGAVMGAVNDGAVYKFITKPWNDDDLRLTVSLALEQFDLLRENRSLKKDARVKSHEIKRLKKFVNVHRSQIGLILVKEKLISQSQLDRAVALQAKKHKVLTRILIDAGYIDERKLMEVIQNRLKINRVSPAEFHVSETLAALIPADICKMNLLVPLRRTDQKLIVAMADPTDYMKVDDLAFITGIPVQPVLATESEILQKLEAIFGEENELSNAVSQLEMLDPTESIEIILDEADEEADLSELCSAEHQPPAIRIVNAIISDALRHGASDVHIEPKNKYIMVRYRIDDLLQDKIHIPLSMQLSIVSRIKIMAELDITERRRPQDGRITVRTSSRMVDMRISTLPTINGEKIVLRILDKNAAARDIEELGFSPQALGIVTKFVDRPQGIILTTGPTGSGKTTTLYGMLRKGAKITKNFTTIEDPVEYHMAMAEQVNIREKIGLSFSVVLRSILRQDPNVIMLGEIRDHETADVALHAALTGHLVLSTLHTNNSIASITRLKDMGIKPYVISDALVGIIAQRLVRCICRHCIRPDQPTEATIKALRIRREDPSFYIGEGCGRCNHTGYSGRVGIYEVFQVDDELRRMIHRNATEQELAQSARLTGMKTLLDDAHDKIMAGVTTCEEILRVLGPQDILDIACPECQARLAERYHFCPFCGRELTPFCRNCDRPLSAEWVLCPQCGIAREPHGPSAALNRQGEAHGARHERISPEPAAN